MDPNIEDLGERKKVLEYTCKKFWDILSTLLKQIVQGKDGRQLMTPEKTKKSIQEMKSRDIAPLVEHFS